MPIVGAYLSFSPSASGRRRYFGGRTYPGNMLGEAPRLMFTMMKATPTQQQPNVRTTGGQPPPHVRAAQILASTGGQRTAPVASRVTSSLTQGEQKTTQAQIDAMRALRKGQDDAARAASGKKNISDMTQAEKDELARRFQLAFKPMVAVQVEPEEDFDDDEEEGGIVAKLWPEDKPVYARPGAIGGVVLVAMGVVAYFKLRSKP